MTKIKNLELTLIEEREFSAMSDKMVLGKIKEKVYNSELGLIEIQELYDNKGNTKKYVLTKKGDWEKIREIQRNFYGEKMITAIIFSEKELEKFFEEREK